MRRTFPQMLSATLLLTLALPAFPQDIEIRGASIALETKSSPIEIVTLENKRDSPLVAWQIGLTRDSKPLLTHSSDFTWQTIHPFSKSGPIKPGERRVIEINIRDRADIGSATLKLAVFDDGYIDGVTDAIEPWQKLHRERADDAAYWTRTLEAIPVAEDAELRRYLETKVGERAAEAPTDPSGIRNRLANFLRNSTQPGSLAGGIQSTRKETARLYDVLTRRPSRAPSLEASIPVVVSSKRDVTTEYVAVVRNLREVAIEAVGFELLDPLSQRPTSGQTADYCCGTNRIGAGGTREFRLSSKVEDPVQPPIGRLTFVMFDDLSFEGSSTRRAEVLTNRERHADDIRHVLRVRSEAASKSPNERVAFINFKRVERAKALAVSADQARLRYLDDLLREAGASPEGLGGDTPQTQYLEKYRAQLLRHLKR